MHRLHPGRQHLKPIGYYYWAAILAKILIGYFSILLNHWLLDPLDKHSCCTSLAIKQTPSSDTMLHKFPCM